MEETNKQSATYRAWIYSPNAEGDYANIVYNPSHYIKPYKVEIGGLTSTTFKSDKSARAYLTDEGFNVFKFKEVHVPPSFLENYNDGQARIDQFIEEIKYFPKGKKYAANTEIVNELSAMADLPAIQAAALLNKYAGEYAKGGRIKSALNRDRKYTSNEPHEQRYPRKGKELRYMEEGGVIDVFPKIIEKYPMLKDFGVKEAFIDPYGEFRMTADYDIDHETFGEIEKYALSIKDDEIITLVPLEDIPLSSQLTRIMGEPYTDKFQYVKSPIEVGVNNATYLTYLPTGQVFKIPPHKYDYVDGYKLVYDNLDMTIETIDGIIVANVVYDQGDQALKFTGEIPIDKSKVKEEFRRNLIPFASNYRSKLYKNGGYIELTQEESERLDYLQNREDQDILTSEENIEYENLVKKYRKTKDYKGNKSLSCGGKIKFSKGGRTEIETIRLAKLGVIASTDEYGNLEFQRIDDPEEWAEDMGYDFDIPMLLNDDHAKLIQYLDEWSIKHQGNPFENNKIFHVELVSDDILEGEDYFTIYGESEDLIRKDINRYLPDSIAVTIDVSEEFSEGGSTYAGGGEIEEEMKKGGSVTSIKAEIKQLEAAAKYVPDSLKEDHKKMIADRKAQLSKLEEKANPEVKKGEKTIDSKKPAKKPTTKKKSNNGSGVNQGKATAEIYKIASEIHEKGKTYWQKARSLAASVYRKEMTKEEAKKELLSFDKTGKKIEKSPSKKPVARKRGTAAKKTTTKKSTSRKRGTAKKQLSGHSEGGYSKRGKSLDGAKQAKPAGKRISKDGNVYYEHRENKADATTGATRGKRFKKGGKIPDRITKMIKSWKENGYAFTNISNDDRLFYEEIGKSYGEVGTTSQTGSDLILYDVNRKSKYNR